MGSEINKKSPLMGIGMGACGKLRQDERPRGIFSKNTGTACAICTTPTGLETLKIVPMYWGDRYPGICQRGHGG